ncbi:hypothetical protein RB12066 [Rhodopirellula baltica SH 1]|uniref:Uncharacterized protein n=2 Tax=Rhodopirellula baltica TaxID=265606 RepID=Q7UJ83_RHOBA|nr:hypothetical protein RB12066 [Rhodopirellula baltica SH 1]
MRPLGSGSLPDPPDGNAGDLAAAHSLSRIRCSFVRLRHATCIFLQALSPLREQTLSANIHFSLKANLDFDPMNPAFIQTVHGFTHPVIASKLLNRKQESGEAHETTTQLYREETARRLEENNCKAKRVTPVAKPN